MGKKNRGKSSKVAEEASSNAAAPQPTSTDPFDVDAALGSPNLQGILREALPPGEDLSKTKAKASIVIRVVGLSSHIDINGRYGLAHGDADAKGRRKGKTSIRHLWLPQAALTLLG